MITAYKDQTVSQGLPLWSGPSPYFQLFKADPDICGYGVSGSLDIPLPPSLDLACPQSPCPPPYTQTLLSATQSSVPHSGSLPSSPDRQPTARGRDSDSLPGFPPKHAFLFSTGLPGLAVKGVPISLGFSTGFMKRASNQHTAKTNTGPET